MTPSPDPTLFAVFMLAIAGPFLIVVAVQEWRQIRAIRRTKIVDQQERKG